MPKQAIAVLSADWHLDRAGRGAWRRYPDISGDSFYSLEQIVDLCRDRELPLLAAGDLFDSHDQDDSSAVKFAVGEMQRMADRELPVLYIQGQHERVRSAPWLSLSPWPQYAHRQIWKIPTDSELIYYGITFTRKDDLQAEFDQVPPDTDVLMMHQVWVDFMGEHIGGECRFADVPHAKLLLTGDFHKHKVVKTTGASGQKLTVVSPGSTCLRSLDEDPDKAVFILYDDLSVESVPLRTRRLYRRKLNCDDELGELLTEIEDGAFVQDPYLAVAIVKPILEVVYDSAIPNVSKHLTALSDAFHLILKPFRNDGFEYDELPGKIELKRGLEGNLKSRLTPDSPEFSLASRLLQSDNPAQTLTEIEKETLAERKEQSVP